ncbi:hypothetical protein [Sorangium sp. So ce233]|uniref:hypothetical protein n=1 Tax=Sorangium sp. So ce233 TaxID=3133290 RepID=UPI003F5D646E
MPDYLLPAHNLCLLNHNSLLDLLRFGEENRSFDQEFLFRNDSDESAYKAAGSILEWLDHTGRQNEYATFLTRTTFSALLSESLHFFRSALDASELARLSVAYALLRKPLQDILHVLEDMALNPSEFADKLRQDPLLLDPKKKEKGRPLLSRHAQRIERVLIALGEADRFDAEYITRLRYDKNLDDSFDRRCNFAMHLVTTRDSMITPPLSLNFVFAFGQDAKLAQWHHLYSRLPYLLFYTRRLFEYTFSVFEKSGPMNLDDVERRISASSILWWRNVPDENKSASIQRFIDATRQRLIVACKANGFPAPADPDLLRMSASGAWPGERTLRVRLRETRYSMLNLRRRAISWVRDLVDEEDADSDRVQDVTWRPR